MIRPARPARPARPQTARFLVGVAFRPLPDVRVHWRGCALRI